MRRPTRIDGFAPIGDYAAIGDGRTVALVALDGSIDWLCLPNLDSGAVFAALLDPDRGGSFELRPTNAFGVERRYADDSNVLETVFVTENGVVKVTDAFLLDAGGMVPWSELVRRVECIDGEIELRWRIAPRPRWGKAETRFHTRSGAPVAEWDDEALVVCSYGAGDTKVKRDFFEGSFRLEAGASAMLALLHFKDEPFALPPQSELELRLDRTDRYWSDYAREIPYEGPWRGAVRRGVLAQRLLSYPETGAIAAAATTSLPERVGGDKNWDYRFSWIRDTSLAQESLLAVRLTVECQRAFDWLVHAAHRTAPRLQPMYALDGDPELPRLDLDFAGYRGSRPVRVGNDAQAQLQLSNLADFVDVAYRYCSAGHVLDERTAGRCVELADRAAELWREPDSGIWELTETRLYTHSRMGCWAALGHAVELADGGKLPDDHAKAWRSTRGDIRDWIEERCWSERRGAYTFHPETDDLDASVLLAARWGYGDTDGERFVSTLDAIRSELSDGPFLYRYSSARGDEGCFLACSFWLVDALARCGRVDEARDLMDELVEAANDVGLYAEQIDPSSRVHLGNTPQALTHLSLILAAVSVMRGERATL